ncbi:MAG TPA: response regulator transcription factor [Chitinispirillaceae bacterium]|nr:response regulator transcription factor [Chitinispirillaceae bacterium]
MKILVIEDNLRLLESIEYYLKRENFLCVTSEKYVTATEKIALYTYDIIIIDINLPDGSGLNLITEAKRKNPSTGIIVISARNSLENKIEGLNLGADDYLTKPFDMAELVARVKALLRRRNFSGTNCITAGEIAVDVTNRKVTVSDCEVDLTKSEFDILLFFLSNPGRTLTRESIAEHIWGDNMDLVDSFDFIYSHIKNLRKKITLRNAKDPIRAVYGIGYKFEIKSE